MPGFRQISASSLTSTLWALCLVLTTPGTRAEEGLTLDHFFRLPSASDVQMSPDGAWVAYTLSAQDLEDDEARSRVWMVPAAGGQAVALTREDESSSHPRWSPDNRYLAFLSARDDGKTQVWSLYRNGGEAVALTDTPQSVKGFEWSPDGKHLLLLLQDPTEAELKAAREDDDAEEDTPPPWVIDREQFKTDYVGYLDRRRVHVYVLDLESKEMTQLTHGDYDADEATWSPDGSRIAFTSNRSANPDADYNTDIWTISGKGNEREPLQVTTFIGTDDSPAWSPDGRFIAHRSSNHPEARDYEGFDLAISSARGGNTRRLTARLDRWVFQPRWSADGRQIRFLVETHGERQLASIPAQGGDIERLLSGKDIVLDFREGAAGDMALLLTRPHAPEEIYMARNGELTRLTSHGQSVLDGIELGAVEKITSQSTDGVQIESFIIKPPGFSEGRRYPIILDIHGGPVAQYDWAFRFEAQWYAANGYLVVQPNPRGSSGYGLDFTMAIWQDWGGPDYHDVMAAVDDVIERGWGDGDNMAVMGWSYGGILTNHVITKTQRFKAAASGASATLYVANYGHDMYQSWWDQELGYPWEDEAREHYERLSPFNDLEKVTTPTLILCGERDWNVPVINSEQLYIGLKKLGVDTELVVYPGEFHGISTPSYRRDLYQRHLDWFDKYLE
jgi:dipeptidyl aminopeptidase/acylaminoacyl peptidase